MSHHADAVGKSANRTKKNREILFGVNVAGGAWKVLVITSASQSNAFAGGPRFDPGLDHFFPSSKLTRLKSIPETTASGIFNEGPRFASRSLAEGKHTRDKRTFRRNQVRKMDRSFKLDPYRLRIETPNVAWVGV
ncbi:hypothetical protein DFH06DRAFT_1135593 [Mycena polygramma]|nr:hypothetical protein DFH06DRAFT_1135593 [Mycena polygramma]